MLGVVHLQEVNGKHLLKAEPLNAILDPQYFVRQVHECVMRVLSDRMAKEQQSADQAAMFRSVLMTTAWNPLLALLPRLSIAAGGLHDVLCCAACCACK